MTLIQDSTESEVGKEVTADPGDQQEDPESPLLPAAHHAGTACQVQTKRKHGAWKVRVFRSVPFGTSHSKCQ